jgi:ferritin-like metal-binding protein YciE
VDRPAGREKRPRSAAAAGIPEELRDRARVNAGDKPPKGIAMGLFTKDIKTMDDLFLHVVQDIYYAENQILKALPDMIEKATNRELTAAFRNHLKETEKQVLRLEQAFDLLGQKPKGTTCPAIDGIIKEAKEVAGEIDDTKVLDAALIAAAQAVEHYEITRYGTLIAWAEELGKDAVAKLLATTLKEEKAADKKLNTLAEKKVNLKAVG